MASTKKYAEIAIAELVEAFPAAFALDPTLVRPLKLGIKDDIYACSGMSHRRVTAALKAYCDSLHYLASCTEGAVRVDLTGAAAGVITAKEAQYAVAPRAKVGGNRFGKATRAPRDVPESQKSMQRKKSAALTDALRKTAVTEESKMPAAISGPKRLSLADLRQAAVARRAGP